MTLLALNKLVRLKDYPGLLHLSLVEVEDILGQLEYELLQQDPNTTSAYLNKALKLIHVILETRKEILSGSPTETWQKYYADLGQANKSPQEPRQKGLFESPESDGLDPETRTDSSDSNKSRR